MPDLEAMRPMRLLIADDDSEVRSWLRLLLRPIFQLEPLEAADGVELLEKLTREGPVDLVITDIRMPRRNGLEAAAEARAAGSTLPFIFITGYGDADTVAVVDAIGRSVLLRKPVDGDVLVDEIHRMLRLQRPDSRTPPTGEDNGGVTR